jgi:hypothetical protein
MLSYAILCVWQRKMCTVHVLTAPWQDILLFVHVAVNIDILTATHLKPHVKGQEHMPFVGKHARHAHHHLLSINCMQVDEQCLD